VRGAGSISSCRNILIPHHAVCMAKVSAASLAGSLEEVLFWRDQLAMKPACCHLRLHGITELHRRLELVRAAMAFKDPEVVAQRTWRHLPQRHFRLAVRAEYLLQLGHGAPFRIGREPNALRHRSIPAVAGADGTISSTKILESMFQIGHLKTITTILPNQTWGKPFKYDH
jgi:hypothetical protein